MKRCDKESKSQQLIRYIMWNYFHYFHYYYLAYKWRDIMDFNGEFYG